jgi:hypothetical protein
MPSANRFTWLRDTVRNHPVVVASSAASAGVLLGGFVAVQLLATPQLRTDSPVAPQAVLASKGEARPIPETTGSAPADDRTASVGCDQETWPHLSPACVEEMRAKNRTRVISTDKLDKPAISAIEASPPAQPESKSAAPAVADTPPVAVSPPVDLVSAPSAEFAAPAPSQPAANIEAKKDKHVATKSKRKLKAEPKARQDADDDDDTSVASNDSDDRASEGRVDRRRIVERWTERDYDVPASSGAGQRRFTVIRRSGGGLFEGLFGN